ncbi:wrb-1 [Pristionchus pacificus]|uniref:Tail-anchored protein insertion receptor WRB n=1 Tax=Pristionchus pacificus TaxID=54126 RepID=A0A8R1V4M5_PRIPA|nr:wrb-1 [Pristionchus pacificus]
MVVVEVLSETAPPSSSPEWNLVWQFIPWIITPIAIAIQLYQSQLASFLADAVRMVYSNREHDEKVRKLATDLSLLRSEQRHLSPVNDFALYFKKDRAIIKLQEQYDQAVRDRSSSAPNSLLLKPVTMAVINLLPILLLNLSSQPTAVCVPYAAFWPFHWLLRFPMFSSPVDSRCDELSTEVSLFVFIHLTILFLRRALRK